MSRARFNAIEDELRGLYALTIKLDTNYVSLEKRVARNEQQILKLTSDVATMLADSNTNRLNKIVENLIEELKGQQELNNLQQEFIIENREKTTHMESTIGKLWDNLSKSNINIEVDKTHHTKAGILNQAQTIEGQTAKNIGD